MIEIDGSLRSGSGTVVRDAVAFSALMGQPIRIRKIRAKRPKPGLRRQHVKAVEAAALISGGTAEGAVLGSNEIEFRPGSGIGGGRFKWDIGTAGSTAMLALTLLPMALFANGHSVYDITGGLFQDYAPSLFYLEHVLLPTLRKMGADIRVRIIRPGYVPMGSGRIRLEVAAVESPLRPLRLLERGELAAVRGIALSSMLTARRVSERMADACRKVLLRRGWVPAVEILNDEPGRPAFDEPAIQAGAALALIASMEGGPLLGTDMAGARGRSAETIGRRTALDLIEDLDSGATVDRHLADQVIPFAALADASSSYDLPRMTNHVEARLWLVQELLGARVELSGKRVTIHGIGMRREQSA